LSEDGRHGLTLIAFVGSVFSPYYAWARRGGAPDPVNHCALNVALYGPRAARWSMTERGAADVKRSAARLALGPSSLHWSGEDMHIQVDELCAPLPRRIRGSIRLTPRTLHEHSYALDGAGLHRWTPFAPCADVQVQLTDPALQWSGVAYLDSNFGAEPVEQAFQKWTWSRSTLPDSTVVLYDVSPRGAAEHSLALRFDAQGSADPIELPPLTRLPASGWRIARHTRADAGHAPRVVQTLEDAPFYSRSLLDTTLLGCRAPAIHESLDLDRFRSRWVQCLLPFRMPRRIF
jgi:carotenoid 1,2-hydratase